MNKAILIILTVLFLALAARGQTCVPGEVPVWTASGWDCQAPAAQPLPVGSAVNMTIANAGVTGTTVNRFAKLTGAPSTAVISSNGDTDGAIGICTSGCGATGTATIAIIGQVSCVFSGATTAGNYVTIAAIGGGCQDAGSTFPTSGATYGRVLSTNGGAGTYVMELMTPDVAFQNAGNGKSKPGGANLDYQWNSSGTFAGGGLIRASATITQILGNTDSLRWGGVGGISLAANAGNTQLILTGGDYKATQFQSSGATPFVYIGDNPSGLALKNVGRIVWVNSNDALSTAYDTGMHRNAAGVVEVNNGTGSFAGTEADLRDMLTRHYFTGKTTIGNCLDGAGAAACGAASAGSVVIDAGATTVVVSTTSVTADSQIFVQYDSSLSTRLGVTCNATVALPVVTARTAATSFTITVPVAPLTDPACYSYFIIN